MYQVCLQNDDDITRASEALEKAETILRENLPSSLLTIKGISTFQNLIMIADVAYEDDFR